MPVPPRDTSTGYVLEAMVLPALERGGYQVKKQQEVARRPGGGRHKVDLVAQRPGEDAAVLVSLKWQQVSGTAEQKVPFEAICLVEAIEQSQGHYRKAYLVLGGQGWSLRDFYVGGGLEEYIPRMHGIVEILTLEDFVARANAGDL